MDVKTYDLSPLKQPMGDGDIKIMIVVWTSNVYPQAEICYDNGKKVDFNPTSTWGFPITLPWISITVHCKRAAAYA